MAREASQRATDHQATERGGRGLCVGEGNFSQEDGCGRDNSLEEGKRSFRGSPPLGADGSEGAWLVGAHGERSEPKSAHQPSHRAGGRGDCANVVPSCSKQGMVANVVASCSKQGMVANVVPSCSKQGMVANVVPSCSKQGMVANVVPSL